MCGILGSVNKSFEKDTLALINHRGPDDSDIIDFKIEDKHLYFGHVRLSIQDLSEAGHQPMYSADKKFIIIFNGEVYNHLELRKKLDDITFKGHSDTETIVNYIAKYGIESVSDLNGIFAFSFVDIEAQKLYLVRDRFGVKPLYYYHENSELVYASEMKPILKIFSKLEANLDAINEYLVLRYNPSPKTVVKGVSKLYPGEVLIYDLKQSSLEKLFNMNASLISNIKIDNHKSEAYWVDAIGEKLEQAVECQMIGDVEVGSFLSGGIDSALITAIASKYSKSKIKTFCIGFNGSEIFNEANDARRSAEILGTEHYDVIANSEAYMQDLITATYINEEPNGTENTFAQYEVSKLGAEHTKVILAGQGADEIFMGYGKYSGELKRDKYLLLIKLLKQFKFFFSNPKYHKLQRALYALTEENTLKRFEKIYTVYREDEKQRLLGKLSKNEETSLDYFYNLIPESLSALDKMSILDTYTSLSDELLLYGDKMTMATSIEMRVPFLDNDLVALAQKIPHKYKIKDGVHKYILKEVAKKYLPEEIINRPKKGFDMPSLEWFQGNLNSEIYELLCSKESLITNYMDKNEIESIILKYKHKKEFDVRKIYLLMNIEHLLRLLNKKW
ncbi:MAG: Asparagine synthetase [glutamine-hydrolyzing] (EC [uncultured Sulfurovum sp.]|uniref:asparagine synthase (glutamine-hydrolyzing) n=1 Tax=uncultured Sulfurovum sp. TaxID=269237 RepID=A0A6S6SWB5_9BACT|nr:MAG: Asparagine synthetase [glutamine-hydrolyzing] (EC [uncultured Sulfurovum sp.]